jgi:hypothetical protein
MKIKPNKKNKTNKTNKTNTGKRNNTRRTNNARKRNKTYKRGGQPAAAYNPSPFWDKIIPKKEREPIVNRLKYLISGSSEKRALLCKEVNDSIPAFQNSPYVPIELPEPAAKENGRTQYVIGGISYFVTTDDDLARLKERLQGNAIAIWNECNNMTCAALMLFGIISSKLQSSGSQFVIVARGGLGIALASSQLPDDRMMMIPVRDLDFKVIKNQTTARGAFDPGAAWALAQNTCSIVQWFLKQIVSDGYDILLGSPQTANPVGHDAIVKISVKPPSGAFSPILDIAFGYAEDMQYYNGLSEISGFVPIGGGAQLPVRFLFQNVHLMLTEKLYFYAKYLFLREQLANAGYINSLKPMRNNTPFGTIAYVQHYGAITITFNGAPITIEQCDWFLEKFQRAIHLLTNIIVEADDTAIHGLASKQNQVFYSTPPQLPPDLRIRVVQSLYPPETHP